MNKISFDIKIPRHPLSPMRILSKYITKKFDRNTPENWNELTLKQLKLAVKLTLRGEQKDVVKALIISFLGINKYYLRFMNMSQLDDISQTLNFLFEKHNLSQQKIPIISVKGTKFHGPKDKLKDFTFMRFIIADTFFLNYIRTKKEDYLNKLIATLYIPEGEAFNDKHIDVNASLVSKMKLENKYSLLLFYIGSREYLTGSFPVLFPKENKQSKAMNKFSWADTIFQLVGDKPGDKEKIDNLDVYFALGYLDKEAAKPKPSL